MGCAPCLTRQMSPAISYSQSEAGSKPSKRLCIGIVVNGQTLRSGALARKPDQKMPNKRGTQYRSEPDWFLRVGLFVVCLVLYPAMSTAEQSAALNLMPVPASVQVGTGDLRIDPSFSVSLAGYVEARLDRAVKRFLRQLARQTALPLSERPVTAGNATLVVQTDHPSKQIQEVGEDESYVLEITPALARLTAPTPLGALHGLQTFLQLVTVSANGFAVPSVTIRDKPRFSWRGLMIDSVRHFIPLDVIRRNL